MYPVITMCEWQKTLGQRPCALVHGTVTVQQLSSTARCRAATAGTVHLNSWYLSVP